MTMLFMMMVMITIRTGRCAAHSTAWLTWMPATGLAQRHPEPVIAREFAHFFCPWHGLIEIGQELPKQSSSCHVFSSPQHVSGIVSRSLTQTLVMGYVLSREPSPATV